MTVLPLTHEVLTSGNIVEVVDFFRRSNPFAQRTWGWDTGRFVDWHWGANTLEEVANPGWFSQHCTIFRDGSDIHAVFVAEYGGREGSIVTGDPDPQSVGYILGWLVEHRVDSAVGLSFEFSDSAGWLRDIFNENGLIEEPNTGIEWEYDVRVVPRVLPVRDGFTIESLTGDREHDYTGIAECIMQAFNVEWDVLSSLRNLEANPMFRPELSVFARSLDGRIAAYCRGTVDPDSGVCGIDPVCCHPDFQRLGLSKAVVQACFRTLGELGGQLCYIGSAPDPAPGTFLYRSLGPVGQSISSTWSLPDKVPGCHS
jgi:ribosomal protein S18 acetylase RimI-like enzyme